MDWRLKLIQQLIELLTPIIIDAIRGASSDNPSRGITAATPNVISAITAKEAHAKLKRAMALVEDHLNSD